MLSVGDLVEDFELADQTGELISWASLRGSPVVVFFYPKASTPGCTKEALAFQEHLSAFADRNVKVLGASADSIKRQFNFAEKHALQMPLLSDPDRKIIEAWGVWGEKKMYGRTSMGIVRSTFLFDAEGRVLRVWSPVKVAGHVDQVLEAVSASFT